MLTTTCFTVSFAQWPLPTQEPVSGHHQSTSSSCRAQSLLPVSQEVQPTFTHIKLPLKRKRVQDNAAKDPNRNSDDCSPAKKKRCCEESSLFKGPNCQIPTGIKIILGIWLPLRRKRVQDDVAQDDNRSSDCCSPARKKRRICEESSLFQTHIPTDSESILEICSPERRSLTKVTEEKDSALTLSTSEDLSSILERWIHEIRLQSEPRPSEAKASVSCVLPPFPELSAPPVWNLGLSEKTTSSTVIRLKPQNTTETARRSSSDVRTSEIPLREKRTNENQRVTKIWIIGSSYIKRGEKAAHDIFGENFGLDAKVEWFGKGGLRWSGVLPRFYEELSTQSPPDILIIHAGGNDLGLISAQELASLIKKDLMQLHAEFPLMTITYSCINERRAWRYGNPQCIDKDRKIVNTVLRKAVDCFGGVVIQHPQLRFFDKSIFVRDGVHFSHRGNELFLTDIQTAIKKILVKSRKKRDLMA